MKCIVTALICFVTISSLDGAETIGDAFQEHFQVILPDEYMISYAGGKPGEKQFSLFHKKDYVISFFVYYDGLDPRNWPSYFEKGKGKDVFLYHEDQIFVYAVLPTEMNDETKLVVRSILESIKKTSSNHGLESTGAPPAAQAPETHP